jgi:hypothetical protein
MRLVADYDATVNLRPVYPLAVRVPGFFAPWRRRADRSRSLVFVDAISRVYRPPDLADAR